MRRMVVLQCLVAALTCMLGVTNNVLSASGAALKISKPGCEQRCGNVHIPFPFGIGLSCSLDEWFEISCNNSTIPHRPILQRTKWEVLHISDFYSSEYQTREFQVKNPISFFDCTGKKAAKALNLSGMPFSVSSYSTFVAVSCGVRAKMESSNSGDRLSQTRCTPICSPNAHSSTTATNKTSCDGTDCCETSIPDNTIKTFEITFENSSTTSAANQDPNGRDCKFAFLVDNYYWNNNNTNIAKIRSMNYVPLNISWYVNYTDFHVFNTNMSFGRVRFHYCNNYEFSLYDRYGVYGLVCRCSGLLGNPYLIDGCSQDINECRDYDPYCGPGGACVNTYGSYHCTYKLKFILIGVGSGLGALLLIFYLFIKKRKDIKRKRKFFKRNGGLLLQQQLSSSDNNVEKTKLFNSNELKKATDNFSVDRILGQGGQGTVYKGMLEDGKIVAIKKSKKVDEAQLSEFINEVVILSQINHRNVVQLLGCCLETEVPLLVYEFISNGTLSQYIHEQNEEFPFTWKMRLRVASEVAGALSYLHSAASFPIYHRDIKSTNILLDENHRAKVADFGTSRTISLEQSHLTTIVYGTFGYLDPEYFQSSQFAEKSDVYSFGVVLVELLTGQKAISVTRSEEERNLATHFVIAMDADNLFDIIDSQVLEDAPKEEIRQIANLAQRCLNLNGRNRPTMKEVAMELEGIRKPERSASIVRQNQEEIEFVRTEFMEPWDVASTSTGSALDKTTSTRSSLLQELPLLSL